MNIFFGWGELTAGTIKEKEKRVWCVITTTHLISNLIPNFVSLPSLPSPKLYRHFKRTSEAINRTLVRQTNNRRQHPCPEG